MKNNQKGFSLIELMAVLVLSSVVLVPLLLSFTNSLQANRQALTSRRAASVAEGALYALEKIEYNLYDTYLGVNDYVVLDADQCNTAFVDAIDQTICDTIFAMESANLSFPSSDFKIYLFRYNFSGEHATLVNDTNLPLSVRNELASNPDILEASLEPTGNLSLIWGIIWLDYYDDPDAYLVSAAIIADDDPR